MSDKVYKCGLIGCGRFGKNYIRTIQQMENVEITHLYTSNPANSSLFKNKVKITDNYIELLLDKKLDFCIIATPPHTHFEIICGCFYHLLPFICEKPICLNSYDSQEIKNLAQKQQIPCLIDNTQLFNPAFIELVKTFKNDPIKSIVSKSASFGPFRKDIGILWDWCGHDLSMMIRLLKETPISVKANLISHPNYDNSGQLHVDVKFKHLVASIDVDNLSSSKYRGFTAESNFLKMTMFDQELFQIRGDSCKTITVSNEKPLTKVISSFIDALEDKLQIDIGLSCDIIKILEKCDESLKNNNKEIIVK